MTHFRAISITLCSMLLSLGVSAQAAKVYKWVDENGLTHYSQTPPPAKAQAEKKLNITTAKPRVSSPTLSGDGLERDEDTSETSPKNDKRKQRIKDLEAELSARQKKSASDRCDALKRKRDNLSLGGRVYEVQDGERKYLSGAEIDSQLEEASDEYNRECS